MRAIVMGAAALALAACASAGEPALDWPALTVGDVEAAYALLAEDHPGMAEEAGDAALRERMREGRALALERAAQVTSLEGYAATLAGLANAAGDRHIWSRPLQASDTVQWAGIVLSLRGGDYIVFDHAALDGEAELAGARLVSCDGVAAERFARDKLGGFSAVWEIAAQRTQRAPVLLADGGNPFVLKPDACVFEQGGARFEHVLRWRDIGRAELSARVTPAMNVGAAGHGLREAGGGYWIALQSLGQEAPGVVRAVEENGAQLRAAPFVVLDMRGNGGGNSSYGDQIAAALFGQARLEAVQQAQGGEGCTSVWRVSERNLAQMRAYRERFAESAPDFVGFIERQLEAAEQAQAEGRAFTGPATCAAPAAPAEAADLPASAAAGRIILLTDNACFSSCLMVADRFRRLGALHLGQTTNANTHYMEVREETLPSGLSVFSTLQALAPAMPAQLGPFAPEIAFDGDMADDAAVEAWVLEIAREHR